MSNVKSAESLLHVLKETSPRNPKFVLFLGAGASVSSGISSGVDLVQKWRGIFNSNARTEAGSVEKQSWYNSPLEYGKLFESIFPTPSLRREFIEQCIGDASPSWGYLYLADLLQHGYVDTVLTTNFDDLINDACIVFSSSLRPLVCSHDAAITHFRLSAARPKIIKLHGDYLFDNIKNTTAEVALLEENTIHKIGRLAEEFGFIVLGYGGNDESVMSCFGGLLRKKESFPHGIYWCARSPEKVSQRVKTFSEDSRFHLVQIDSFDGFIADAHECLVGESPAIISDPFGLVSNRLSKLLRGLEKPATKNDSHTALNRDFNLLAKNIKTDEANSVRIDLPAGFVGALTFSRGDYPKALPILIGDLHATKSVKSLVLAFECLRHHWDEKASEVLLGELESASYYIQQQPPQFYLSATLSLIHAKQYEKALQTCDMGQRAFKLHDNKALEDLNTINRIQITLHDNKKLSESDLAELKTILEQTQDPRTQFGCNVLLGHHREAVEVVEKNKSEFQNSTSDWPIVQLLPRAQSNELLEFVGTGQGHLGALSVDFTIETNPK